MTMLGGPPAEEDRSAEGRVMLGTSPTGALPHSGVGVVAPAGGMPPEWHPMTMLGGPPAEEGRPPVTGPVPGDSWVVNGDDRGAAQRRADVDERARPVPDQPPAESYRSEPVKNPQACLRG